jgi:hypothetical protein
MAFADVALGWALADVPNAKARGVCDHAAATLFQSADAAEITRAGIILRGLHCDLSKRLPKD